MGNDNNKALATRAPAQAARIDEITTAAVQLFKEATASFGAELAIAQAMTDMREALTPDVMKPLMGLMNTDLGFRTDGRYDEAVVRDCFIEARLRGFRAVGNEWNIIQGRFYAAKNGLRRKVREWPGLTDLKEYYEPPKMVGEVARVKCGAAWKMHGVPDQLDAEIDIRVNRGSVPDAIIGKAQRKLLLRIHDRLGGVTTPDGEVDDVSAVEGAPIPTPTAPPPPATRKADPPPPAALAAAEFPPEHGPPPKGFDDELLRPCDELGGEMMGASNLAELDACAAKIGPLVKAGTITHEERDVLKGVYRDMKRKLEQETAA